ncbi:hypothetical protein [Mesorhizobium sp. Root695]|uniref:hypothetical protein n=1 Tax=Mesorhizobium sp. Root695 TaxID=1736589 RepID=UPI0012E358CC|nr:hypothetical protein [Mesorhizobium sp. Root695]
MAHANVARFHEMLSHKLSPEQRHVVEGLLAKEELRLLVLEASEESAFRSGLKLVAAALSTHHAGETISTKSTIEAVRWAWPDCNENDDELTACVVQYAKERQLVVLFDAR